MESQRDPGATAPVEGARECAPERALVGEQDALDPSTRAQILEVVPHPVFWKDCQGVYRGCNEAFARAAGLATPAEIVGKTDFDLPWPRAEAEAYRAGDRVVLESGEARRHIVEPLQQADGRRRWVETTKLPLRTADGEVCGVVGFCEDITERKRAEAGLQLNESRLEALLHLNQMTEASLKEITEFAMEEAVRLTRSKLGYIAFASEDESVLTMFAWSKGAMAECAVQDRPVDYVVAETGLWGEAVRQRRPIITNDYAAPNPWKKGTPAGHVALRRHMNVPVFDGDRIVIVAGVGNKEADYDESDVRQLTLLMGGMWRIVQRKRAEEKLRESETKYRALFEASGDATFVLGVDHDRLHVVECNPRALEMFGASRQQIGTLPIDHFWAARQADGTPSLEAGRARVRQALEAGIASFEWRHQRLDETVFDTDVVLTRVPLGTGLALLAVVRDVTERKRAEEALRLSEATYRSIFNTVRDAIWVHDLETREFVDVNDSVTRLFGYSVEEVKALNVGDISSGVHPFTQEAAAELLNKAMAGQPQLVEWHCRHKDGHLFWSEVQLCRGTIAGKECILAIERDITERKQAESELRESERKYRDLSQEFQSILGAIPGSLVLLTPDLRVVWANEFAATSMGVAPGDILGTHCYRFRHNRAEPCEACPVLRCFATGQPQSADHATPDGRVWELHAAPVFDEQGAVSGVIEIAYEVTEYRRAARELQASESRLRGLFQAAPIGILFVQDRKIVSVNEFTGELLGYDPAELVGKPSRHLYFTQEEFEEVGRELYGPARAGGHAHIESCLRRKDGTAVEVSLTSAPLRLDERVAGFVVTVQDITERKRAEQRLRESEALLARSQQIAHLGSWELDLTSNRLTWSEEVYRIFGYDPKAFAATYEAFLEAVHPDDRAAVDEAYSGSLREGKDGYEIEHRVVRRDTAEVRHVREQCVHERNAAGSIIRSVGMVQDITERKRAEQALQSRLVAMTRPLDDTTTITFADLFDVEEIQRLQDAFTESSGTAQLITEPDGTPITQPSGFCRLCGEFVRKSEKGRQRCHLSDSSLGRVSIDGPTVRPCLSAGLWGAGASIMVGGKHIANWLIGQVRNEQLDMEKIAQYAAEIDADPEEFRAALLEVPVMSEEQFRKTAHTLFVLSKELSTKAYQNVQQARFIADLKRMEEERDRLFNLSIDMLCIAGFDGRFKQVNPAWTRTLGWSAEELTRPAWLELVHPDDVQATAEAGNRLRRGEEVRSFENRYRCKDGAYRWLSWNSYPLMAQQLIFGVCRDVTDHKAAEVERAKLEVQLRQSQKMEAVGQLAGGVAHDFNNILTAIFGQLDLAARTLETRYPQARDLLDGMHQVERSAQRAAALTRQLLAFSRRQVVQPAVLDLNATLRDLEKMLRRLLTENIVFKQHLAPDLAPIRADAGQLEQVILNLAVNARDAMPAGGRLTIETRNVVLDESYVTSHPEVQPGAHVLLNVTDTGCGMDRATLEHLFEPFFTTKPVGRGTGLGLSTVYGIVRQAGGHVSVYSEVGRGTSVKVYLPAVAAARPAARPTPRPPAPLGSETLMVCEDDDAVRELTSQALKRAGYTVLTASHAESALELAAGHAGPIQLLITDVIMPGMNGRQLSEALTRARPDIRTLFLSGYTSDVIAHHGVLDEHVNFLEKPFGRLRLLQKVREVLDAPPQSAARDPHAQEG